MTENNHNKITLITKNKFMKKNTKKRTKLIVSLLVLILLIASAIGGFIIFSNQKNGKVAATVNGEKIYQSELEDRVAKMLSSRNPAGVEQKIAIDNLPQQVIEAVAKDIYLQREIDKIAGKSKEAKDGKIKKQAEEYKKGLIRQAYLAAAIKKEVTEETIKNKYTQLSTELAGKKEMHLRHIMVSSQEKIEKIKSMLKTTSFEKLAKQYSEDGANAAKGGDLGYVVPDRLDEDFSKAISELKKNQISAPIKTKFGWHIVKVEDVRDVKIPTFEEAKAEIEQSMKREVVEKLFGKITENSKVKILIDLKSQENKEPATPEDKEEVKTPEAVNTPEAAKDDVKDDTKK
ncbi:MAG: PpiC-type peptidyl-prolyl cis-trans isomerase [Rickettsiaceae bacterium]|nr:PpiC-type peptidyl-prolyl cis-trans isomerase [Rickettsiaceae bacterium]